MKRCERCQCKSCGRFLAFKLQVIDPEVQEFIEKLAKRKDEIMWGQGKVGFQDFKPSSVELKSGKWKATPRYILGINIKRFSAVLP